MNDEHLDALVNARFEQAQEALQDAEILQRQGGSPRATINRAYYAAFYATLALLQLKRQAPRKHMGVVSLFDREFVKTGKFDKEYSKHLHRLFAQRQEHDYKTLFEQSNDDANLALSLAKQYVEAVRGYLYPSSDS